MADDYEDLVELGFEGIDRATDKYHDAVVDFAKQHKPKLSPFGKHTRNDRSHRDGSDQHRSNQHRSNQHRSNQHRSNQHRSNQHRSNQHRSNQHRSNHDRSTQDEYKQTRLSQDLPPPPPQDSHRRLPSDRYGENEAGSDREHSRKPGMYGTYGSDRRRDDWRDDGVVEDTGYGYNATSIHQYGAGGREQSTGRDRDAYGNAGAVTRQGPPPAQYEYAAENALGARERPLPSRRRSSWSPPRRSDRRYGSPPRRARSKSPNAKNRAAAVILGAFAGGLAGSRVKKSQPVANSVSTVLGAVVGGLGAREAEQLWDRRKDKRRGENERGGRGDHGERRERRRSEREGEYN